MEEGEGRFKHRDDQVVCCEIVSNSLRSSTYEDVNIWLHTHELNKLNKNTHAVMGDKSLRRLNPNLRVI